MATGANEVIRLWPDGPPTPIDGVPDEVELEVPEGIAKGTTFIRNISDPTLTVFPPADGAANGEAVIVVPAEDGPSTRGPTRGSTSPVG